MVEIAREGSESGEEIAQFMDQVFPKAKWSLDAWRALLDGRWSPPGTPVAVTVRDMGRLVGVLGLVSAKRPTSTGSHLTANMTSWYLLKPYRGGGIGREMIDMATSDPNVTVTNFNSSKNAVPVVLRAGLGPLDAHRLNWRSTGPGKLKVHRDPLALGTDLPDRDRQIVADHAGLDLTPLAIETPDGICTLILAIKRKSDAYVTHEVLHTGSRELLGRHAGAIADSILPADGAVLSVDSRFVPPDTQGGWREDFPVPRFYTPGRMPREDVDFLYSEIVILGIKL